MMSLENDKQKCEIWHPEAFLFSFFGLACERIFIKMHIIESRYVKGLEDILFASVSASFSPEILQAGAVKGLTAKVWSNRAIYDYNVHIIHHIKLLTAKVWSNLAIYFPGQGITVFSVWHDKSTFTNSKRPQLNYLFSRDSKDPENGNSFSSNISKTVGTLKLQHALNKININMPYAGLRSCTN